MKDQQRPRQCSVSKRTKESQLNAMYDLRLSSGSKGKKTAIKMNTGKSGTIQHNIKFPEFANYRVVIYESVFQAPGWRSQQSTQLSSWSCGFDSLVARRDYKKEKERKKLRECLLFLGKDTLKYLGVKGCDVYNLLSNGSRKKHLYMFRQI